MKKPVTEWTVEEFRALPRRSRFDSIEEPFDSLVILPDPNASNLHDSGYRCMDFVGVREGVPVCRLSGCSDVINIEGIGGGTYRYSNVPPPPKHQAWSIDCLPTSGLLCLFAPHGRVWVGPALSNFEVYSVRAPPETKP